MATDGTTRRSLLAAGVGAIAAAVAGAFGRPQQVHAADGSPMILGNENTATDETRLSNETDADTVFYASSLQTISPGSGTGTAISGYSALGVGVGGLSGTGNGVLGASTTRYGVEGSSSRHYGVFGHTDAERRAGVLGQANQLTSSGVVGVHAQRETSGTLGGDTYGVLGVVPNTPGRVAVGAFALENAIALRVDGKATFSRSGRATVPRGRSAVDVLAPGGLDALSLVLAVPMVNRPGVFVQAVVPNPATGTFRINLNRVASSTSSTPVAWFIVN